MDHICKGSVVFFLFISLILANYKGQAQVLPSDRSANWGIAGLNETVAENELVVNILDFGGIADGSGTNDEAFSKAVNSLEGGAGTIYFPSGTYLFNATIYLKSGVVLKGASAANSTLKFDLGGVGDLIVAEGTIETDTFYLNNTIDKDSEIIDISGLPVLMNEGDHFRIAMDDRHLVTSDWAYRSAGQIARVKTIDAQAIGLHSPLRMGYDLAYKPFIQKINPIKNVGIECLKIVRADETVFQTSNLAFRYAANCWVRGVESVNCNYTHVEISYSSNIEVSGSYLQEAFGYGNGGKAYGVTLQYTSGECLIENNVFRHLRHAVLLQAGANANVIGYNYSLEPYWTDVSLPADASGDIVLHGNYPYANLIEGNVVQNIIIDDSHGKNGPYNTFFRNRAKLYGIFMNSNPASDKQNFIGNVVENTGFLKGFYQLEGAEHFGYGNFVKGSINPAGTDDLKDTSYYYTSKPAFLNELNAWPSIGIPNTATSGTNAAVLRYQQRNGLAVCGKDSIETGLKTTVKQATVKLYPNPFSNIFTISLQNDDVVKVHLYDQTGRLILRDQFQGKQIAIDLSQHPAGSYFVTLDLSGKRLLHQLLKW